MPLSFFAKKKEPPSVVPPAPVGAFGKVPQMAHFLRTGTKPLPAFETWLEAGMAWGEKKHAANWPTVYAAGASHSFVYRRPPRPVRRRSSRASFVQAKTASAGAFRSSSSCASPRSLRRARPT